MLGRHRGLHQWTLGQRIPLGMLPGGVRAPEGGLFVAAKDVGANTLLAVEDTDHPALYCEHFHCVRPRWIRSRAPGELR